MYFEQKNYFFAKERCSKNRQYYCSPKGDAAMSNIHEIINIECTEIEKEAAVASFAHFLSGRYWDKVHMMLGISSTIIAAVASATAITNNPKSAAVIAALAAVFSGFNTFLSPGDRASLHSRTHVLFTEIRRNANLLRDIDAPLTKIEDEDAVKELINRLRELVAKMTAADQNAPGNLEKLIFSSTVRF
jgi:hypothetical protein